MPDSEKTTWSIEFFFRVKRSVSDSYTIRKNYGQKSSSESSKMREKQILGPKESPLVTKRWVFRVA